MKPLFKLSFALAAAIAASSLFGTGQVHEALAVNSQDEVENSRIYQAPRKAYIHKSSHQDVKGTYSSAEIVDAGHHFFGTTTKGLAKAVEHVFARAGRPRGYIIGEEGAGAFIGGLRYGEGILFMKDGTRQKVFWQGPSIGFDFGGNGSRSLVLVYDIDTPRDIFDRFIGVEGTAYLIGGLGVNFQSNEKLKLAPIRTGVGARLGANVGYLKYTARPTWNPF